MNGHAARLPVIIPDEGTGRPSTAADPHQLLVPRPGRNGPLVSLRQIEPKQRGLLIVNSHPEGAARSVRRTWDAIPPRADGRRPVVLVLGHSAGYGLATLLTGLRRHGIRGIGVAFETPDNGRRTATAGWYRTAAAAELAADGGTTSGS